MIPTLALERQLEALRVVSTLVQNADPLVRGWQLLRDEAAEPEDPHLAALEAGMHDAYDNWNNAVWKVEAADACHTLLRHAHAFAWTSATVATVCTAAEHYPLADAVLQESSLYLPTGWWWSEDTPFVDMDGYPVHGILWGTTVPGILDLIGFTRPPQPHISATFYFGHRNLQNVPHLLSAGHPETYHRMIERLCAVFLTGSQFLHQRILTRQRAQPDRALRRRCERALRDTPTIDVISLRRTEPHRTDGSREVEWACRWLVSGHWRSQFHPSDGTYVPTWIDPYVKGPADKPLKRPPTRVFAVER